MRTSAVLLVDDDAALRTALERLLRTAGFTVLSAEDADAGLAALEREGDARIGVVISDHAMPGMDGVAFLKTVRQRWPRVARILLTGAADLAAAARAVNEAQVARLLLKPCSADELRGLVGELLQQHAASVGAVAPADGGIALTPRERQVLACLARGASNAEIAADLHVTPGSARIYVNRILAKLGLPDRTKAALYARSLGLGDL